MVGQGKPIRGTREWAVANIDCCTGCPHDCLYCYARYDAVVLKGLVSATEWRSCKVRSEEVLKIQPLFPGQVMFPTTHDIVPENIDACISVIHNLLIAGNKVLIVSKPNIECVRKLCNAFDKYKSDLLFRFTITSRNSSLLCFWEPGAPGYEERKESLCYAFEKGYHTSVSVEPMLDTVDVVAMVRELLPCVTHSVWLGKMNKIEQRVQIDSYETQAQVEKITEGQSDQVLHDIYRQLCNEPLVRWKESIKEVIGLELSDKPGLDK